MTAPDPQKPPKKQLLARPTGKIPSAEEMHERVMKRYPKVMARLAEIEREEEASRR
jgi:hypothetical protein